jgi:hypothetical protein
VGFLLADYIGFFANSPIAPEIITTVPTVEMEVPRKKQSRLSLATRLRRSGELPRNSTDAMGRALSQQDRRKTIIEEAASSSRPPIVTFEEPSRPPSSKSAVAVCKADHNGLPAILGNRLSESSRSDISLGDPTLHTVTNTTSHTPAPTTSRFFRLPRRRQKIPEPLFPLSHLPQQSRSSAGGVRPSISSSSLAVPASLASTSTSNSQMLRDVTPRPTYTSRPSSEHSEIRPATPPSSFFPKPTASQGAIPFRTGSIHSGHSSPTRNHFNRGRSSTMSSMGRDSGDDYLAPPTTRTSSSTGRKSFGDLFGLSRLRQNTELSQGRQGTLTPATPGSNTSKNNSLQLSREPVSLPDRRDDENPAKYLARLEDVVSRGVIASALSRGTDAFSAAVLRSYMRSFSFFGDPMDMAIRKLLMEAELPKETQQIDRCLQAFANRYHECNPGVYSSPDQAYFVAFSLLILHTDVFNKNNKHKMLKVEYLKNTRGEGIFDEILECLYDNITYTPFIHVEDDMDINGERIVSHKVKRKTLFPNSNQESSKRPIKEPIDPYTLIIDGSLDLLRPSLKDVMCLDDPYSYLGTAKSLDLKTLQNTFFKTGVLQIVSARSRPDAFMSEKTASNPEEAHPGIVDIKITKVGLLWRKDAKKKKTRSPWQEWGAILTGAQLYFFRNTNWIKSLMHQYDSHIKQGHDGIPIIFKPPLENFKPDALMSTDGAVALLDSTYRKHKHAFVYVRHGGFEEVLLADDEDEMNDWLAKLNYAAAFRTSGVRIRGVVGGNYDGQSRRGIRRLDSSDATQLIQTPTGEVSIARGRIDHKMAEDILTARREIMVQKVAEADEKLAATEKLLDTQLRNARHLQILAPIQGKTRDQLLLSAARMEAQLKWTRIEMWRIKCHRDILLQDLEEERQIFAHLGSSSPIHSSESEANTSSEHIVSKLADSNAPPRILDSPTSPPALSLMPTQANQPPGPDSDSTSMDEFQTPPTSATLSTHKHQHHWEMSPKSRDLGVRRSSVSSVASSHLPEKAAVRHSMGPEDSSTTSPTGAQNDVEDAAERDLLERAGLLNPGSKLVLEQNQATNGAESLDTNDQREHHHAGADKLDKNKIRRSLHRTLRESASHLSHHRSRKGKDSASSGVSDDTVRDDMLTRGTGSFVVHGKKASVINFGTELQNMSQDEKLRQRKHASREYHSISPANGGIDDFRSALGDTLGSRERRESAASASTATARSFRELHRKYSSAQSARAASSGGRLAIPSDGESEAAVSFSDGRRTPLPPVDSDSADSADEGTEINHDESLAENFTSVSPGNLSISVSPEEDAFSTPRPDKSSLPGRPIQAVNV